MKKRLFLLATAALAPGVGLLAINEVTYRAEREREVHRMAQQASRQAASEIERLIEGMDGLLIAVAANAAVGEGEASVDVVAVESSLQFRAPLHGDIEIRAWADDGESGRFHQRLKRRGKASLAILARATDAQGVVVSEYQSLYLARNNTDNA